MADARRRALAVCAAPHGEHDAASAAAMAAHHAAPPSPPLATPDPLTEGLLRGFLDHTTRPAGDAPPRQDAISGAEIGTCK